MTPSLSETFDAAEHDDVGPLGVLGRLGRDVDLLEDELAGGVRELRGDVVDAGLLAVHDAEAVGDVGVGQRGEVVGERRALGVVLGGLAGVEPDVLQQGDVAVAEAGDDAPGVLADGVRGQGDVLAQQLAEPRGDRGEGVLRVRGALGTAQVRGEDDLRALRR